MKKIVAVAVFLLSLSAFAEKDYESVSFSAQDLVTSQIGIEYELGADDGKEVYYSALSSLVDGDRLWVGVEGGIKSYQRDYRGLFVGAGVLTQWGLKVVGERARPKTGLAVKLLLGHAWRFADDRLSLSLGVSFKTTLIGEKPPNRLKIHVLGPTQPGLITRLGFVF